MNTLSFFLFFFSPIVSSYMIIPKVGYISFSHISVKSRITPTNDSVFFTLVQRTDDSPFESYQLPWPFNFFGRDIDKVFISPNGAIHMDPLQPCGGFFCGDYNSSFLNVIAPLLTDLDPSANLKTSISATVDHKNLLVEISYDRYYQYSIRTKSTQALTPILYKLCILECTILE